MVVERLKSCANIVALAQELGLHRRLLYKWREQLEPVAHGEPVPGSPPPVDTCARCSGHLATASLPEFDRRCLLARLAARLASSLDFLQGTFEKIHLQRFLRQNSL